MPTGYTSDIYEGKKVSFKQFAMNCARAFGACVTMREDDMNAEIPEKFEPSDYHKKALEKAQKDLVKAEKMTLDEAEKLAAKEHAEEIASCEASAERRNATNARYDSMIEKVRAWVPPTSEHHEFKKFMLNQLEISRENWTPDSPKKKSGAAFKLDKIKRAKYDIEYHTKEYAEEVERAASRSTWVRNLRESL